MIIYGSTQWVDPSENKEWYSLEVINQWDWKTDPVCFQNLSGHLISYCLNKNTAINDTQAKRERVTKMKEPKQGIDIQEFEKKANELDIEKNYLILLKN